MSLIGKSVGNYLIKAKLGEGGMGAVYLGEHPLIGKRVAVKVLLEELAAKEDIVQRFFNEAKAVNDIGHSNIVDIVDFGKMKSDTGTDIVYFIMEFLDGESLAARLRRTGLSFSESLHVIGQCCSALSASHKKGIVHRDLKPENIYLCPRSGDKNFVKILDFGIAKLTGDGGQSHKTRTGLVIGTPAYMSPEQCEGKGLIDRRSDVYSLGVVMYELLTGRVPFPGEGFGEILVAHLTKQAQPLAEVNPDVTPELDAIVMHAIEKDRNRRFQDMDEFEAAIHDPAAHLAAWQAGVAMATSAQSGGTMMLDDMGQAVPKPPTGAHRQVNTNRTGTGQGARPITGQGARPITGQGGRPITGQGARPITGSGPRPTTLSGAAGESMGDPGARSKTPMIAAVAAAVLVVGGVGGFLALRSKGDAKVPAAGAGTEGKADDQITITVRSDPPGAKVYRADEAAPEPGVTPLKFEVKRNSPSFDIQVKLDGHRSSTPRTVTTDRNQALLIPLEKIEVAEKPVEPVPVANNTPPPTTPTPGEKKPDKKSDHHHHSSSSGPGQSKTDKKPAANTKKSGEEGGDDMKLLTPKF